jgi:hypothetical protein
MDWLTFFSTVIKSLAWPAVVIVALFLLKRKLTDLLRGLGNRLTKAKGGGFEFTFGERVDQVEESLPPSEVKEITLPTADAHIPERVKRIESISELSQLPPPYIVSQAWLKLEQAIRDAVVIPSSPQRPPRSAFDYIDLATRNELLFKDEVPAVQQLRELRNQAAHSIEPAITITDALRYYDIANSLIQKIRERGQHKKPT